MNKFKKWLIPVALVCLLLATLVGCSSAPASLGETFDPSGNPFANRFSDVKDIRTATFVVAASDSEHRYEADYFCNGTNDHVQIQAAIDALPATGGEVLLLDGTYNIEVSLVLDSYQTLRGCGRNTILTTTTAFTDIITATGGSGTEKVGILIADLCVDGNAHSNAVGILLTYVDYSKVINVWVQDNAEDGIRLVTCDNNTITGNTCQGNWENGIRLYDSCYNNTITGNTSQGNNNGIYLETACDKNTITGNTIQGNDASNIQIEDDCNNNTISGNTCQGSGADSGIYLTYDCDNNTITGNTCQGNALRGIQLEDTCDNNTITGNVCQGNDIGIYVSYSCYNNTISGNICQGNVGYGISLYSNCKDNTITGNTCQRNGDYSGIYLNDECNDNTIIGNTCHKNGEYGIGIETSNNNVVTGNNCQVNAQTGDDTYDNIILIASDYNILANNMCRAPTIGTTLSAGEPIGETEIALTAIAGFVVGMGVVIDLGGANEEYHRIISISGSVITIPSPGLANVQAPGASIDVPEARYGINVSNATCDKNIIQGNDLYDSGKTGNFNDAGTLTTVRDDNRDITPFQVKHLVYVQNTSGGNLLTGNVVAYEAAAAAVGFHSPTAIGDPMVWGMLAEDIDNNAFGYIQVLGGTVVLDATNAGGGAIVIGDLLCTEVGSRARKVGAASDHIAFAIAMENGDAADLVLNALIITPRNTP